MDKLQYNETCSCGAAFTADAEGQSALGMVRMRHKDWLEDHKVCGRVRQEAGYPQKTQLVTTEIHPGLWLAELLEAMKDQNLMKQLAYAINYYVGPQGPIVAPTKGSQDNLTGVTPPPMTDHDRQIVTGSTLRQIELTRPTMTDAEKRAFSNRMMSQLKVFSQMPSAEAINRVAHSVLASLTAEGLVAKGTVGLSPPNDRSRRLLEQAVRIEEELLRRKPEAARKAEKKVQRRQSTRIL